MRYDRERHRQEFAARFGYVIMSRRRFWKLQQAEATIATMRQNAVDREGEVARMEVVVAAAKLGSCDMTDGCPPNERGEFCEGCKLGPALARLEGEKPPPWKPGPETCSACGLATNDFHWYPTDPTGFRLCHECNPGELRHEIERLNGMLEQAWRKSGPAWNWPKDEWLTSLAARHEVEQGGGGA